jgi:hypothetical protein
MTLLPLHYLLTFFLSFFLNEEKADLWLETFCKQCFLQDGIHNVSVFIFFVNIYMGQ